MLGPFVTKNTEKLEWIRITTDEITGNFEQIEHTSHEGLLNQKWQIYTDPWPKTWSLYDPEAQASYCFTMQDESENPLVHYVQSSDSWIPNEEEWVTFLTTGNTPPIYYNYIKLSYEGIDQARDFYLLRLSEDAYVFRVSPVSLLELSNDWIDRSPEAKQFWFISRPQITSQNQEWLFPNKKAYDGVLNLATVKQVFHFDETKWFRDTFTIPLQINKYSIQQLVPMLYIRDNFNRQSRAFTALTVCARDASNHDNMHELGYIAALINFIQMSSEEAIWLHSIYELHQFTKNIKNQMAVYDAQGIPVLIATLQKAQMIQTQQIIISYLTKLLDNNQKIQNVLLTSDMMSIISTTLHQAEEKTVLSLMMIFLNMFLVLNKQMAVAFELANGISVLLNVLQRVGIDGVRLNIVGFLVSLGFANNAILTVIRSDEGYSVLKSVYLHTNHQKLKTDILDLLDLDEEELLNQVDNGSTEEVAILAPTTTAPHNALFQNPVSSTENALSAEKVENLVSKDEYPSKRKKLN